MVILKIINVTSYRKEVYVLYDVDVTVVIPVFNGENFILDLINCLKKQTYTNAEFIIVNDGSVDNTETIILRETFSDARFKYYKQCNTGVSAARNTGIKHSKGRFITFVDADDYVSPDYIALLMRGIQQPNISLAVTNIQGDHIELNEHRLVSSEAYLALYTKFKGYVWSKIFINSIIQKNHLSFDTNLSIGEDLKFVFDYALIFKKDFQIMFMDKDVYKYEKRTDSATHQNIFLFYYNLSIVSDYLIKKTEWLSSQLLSQNIIKNFLYFYYKQKALADTENIAMIVPTVILKQRRKRLVCGRKTHIKIFLWRFFPKVCRYISYARG